MLTCAILPLLGIVVGWFANHWLSNARDRRARQYALEDARDARKRDFLGFMDRWRTEVERDNPHKTANEFTVKCASFRQEGTKIRDDYGDAFRALVGSLSGLRDSEVEEIDSKTNEMIGRQKLLAAIDAVMNFVREH